MSIRDLREKYGDVKGNIAINNAVRNELPGGEKLLNLTAWLFRQENLSDREQNMLKTLLVIQREMKQFIIEKYELKNRRNNHDDIKNTRATNDFQ
jgi:hypothetical protein